MKKRRIDANLRQQDVAARLDWPQSFVAKYESGERRLDVVEFIEVAEAIGFDPADFIRDFRSSEGETGHSVTSPGKGDESAHVETPCPAPAPAAPERWRVRARAGGVFAINVDRGDGGGFRPPPPDEVEAALRRFSDPSAEVQVSSAPAPMEESTAGPDGVDAVVPSRAGLSHKPAVGVPSRAARDDGTGEPQIYRDKAGRRRQRHLASPEARRARNAKARELRTLGKSIREIAHELGCGHGTVERALKEH